MPIYRYYTTHRNYTIYITPAVGLATGPVEDVYMGDGVISDFGYKLKFQEADSTIRPLGFIDENKGRITINLDRLEPLNSRPEVSYNMQDAIFYGTTDLATTVLFDNTVSLGFKQSNLIEITHNNEATGQLNTVFYGLQDTDNSKEVDEDGFITIDFTDLVYGLARNIETDRLWDAYLREISTQFIVPEKVPYRRSFDMSIPTTPTIKGSFSQRLVIGGESEYLYEYHMIALSTFSNLLMRVLRDAFRWVTNFPTSNLTLNLPDFYSMFEFYSSINQTHTTPSGAVIDKLSVNASYLDNIRIDPKIISAVVRKTGETTGEYIDGVFFNGTQNGLTGIAGNVAELLQKICSSNMVRGKVKYVGIDAYIILSYLDREIDENQQDEPEIDFTNRISGLDSKLKINGNLRVTDVVGVTPDGDETTEALFSNQYNNNSKTGYEYDLIFNNYTPEFEEIEVRSSGYLVGWFGSTPITYTGKDDGHCTASKMFGLYQTGGFYLYDKPQGINPTAVLINPYTGYNDGNTVHTVDWINFDNFDVAETDLEVMNRQRDSWNSASMPFASALAFSSKFAYDKDHFSFKIHTKGFVDSNLLGVTIVLDNVDEYFKKSNKWITGRLPNKYQVVSIEKDAYDNAILELYGVK